MNLRGGFKRRALSSMPSSIIEAVAPPVRDKCEEAWRQTATGMTRAQAKEASFAERHPPAGLTLSAEKIAAFYARNKTRSVAEQLALFGMAVTLDEAGVMTTQQETGALMRWPARGEP